MSILKREVLYDYTGGIARFLDMAVCTTTLGTMSEPFSPNNRFNFGNFQDFDPTDEINRVDCIRAINGDKAMLELSGGAHQLIGGVMNPKVGR